MSARLLLFLSGVALSQASASADLAPGIGYVRIRSAAAAEIADLQATGRPQIVDLRGARAGATEAAAFATALASRPRTHPLVILVGPETPPGMLPASLPRGSVTLGVATSRPPPMVAIAQDPADDARAFAALDAGQPLAELIDGHWEKERFDEASLVREFENGNPAPEPPPEPDPTAPGPTTAPPLRDRVLQRAWHIIQALAATRPPG